MDRICLFCKKAISGRSDKKFCDHYCRNGFNNSVVSDFEKLIKETNRILRKNRTILKTASPHGKTTVRKEYLDIAGFNFEYFTFIFAAKNGSNYRFCYDYGYLALDNERILIVNWQNYMSKLPVSNFTKQKFKEN
jgi:ubiquinone/menaquinone biosynthesis C-methylase UbiE